MIVVVARRSLLSGAPRLPRPRHRRRRRHPVRPAGAGAAGARRRCRSTSSLLGAAAIFLVSFARRASSPPAASAQRGGYPVDADREMVGFGAANIAAGLFGAFPVTASDSPHRDQRHRRRPLAARGRRRGRGAARDRRSTCSRRSRILPIPALGAILIAAALSLIDVDGAARDLADQPRSSSSSR